MRVDRPYQEYDMSNYATSGVDTVLKKALRIVRRYHEPIIKGVVVVAAVNYIVDDIKEEDITVGDAVRAALAGVGLGTIVANLPLSVDGLRQVRDKSAELLTLVSSVRSR